MAFTIDLPLLFQEALRGILEDTPWLGLDGERPRAKVVNQTGTALKSSNVDPDYVIRTGSRAGALLLDAKYKRAVETVPADPDDGVVVPVRGLSLYIKRADVYQATAYRRHLEWADSRAALVYPIALEEGSSLPDVHRVEGFDEPVHVLFLDVGPSASRYLPAFRDQLHYVQHLRA